MIIIRLVFLGLTRSSTDHTYDDFHPALMTSIHINFSVIFTCLPFLKNVIDNMQTGMLAGEIHVRSPAQISGHKIGRSGNPAAYGLSVASAGRGGGHDHSYLASVDRERQGYNKLRFDESSQERMVINQTTTIHLESSSVS